MQYAIRCEESGEARLNMVSWLRRLGDSWVRTMSIPLAERNMAVLPPPPDENVSAAIEDTPFKRGCANFEIRSSRTGLPVGKSCM
eukprot:COSAG05_NODE_444_length_9777_cov_20.852965_8_plen_85_part_00